MKCVQVSVGAMATHGLKCLLTSRLLVPAGISTVLCDNQSKAEALLQISEKGQASILKTVVVMDSFSSECVERGSKCGVDVVSMQDVEVFDERLVGFILASCPERTLLCFHSLMQFLQDEM